MFLVLGPISRTALIGFMAVLETILVLTTGVLKMFLHMDVSRVKRLNLPPSTVMENG